MFEIDQAFAELAELEVALGALLSLRFTTVAELFLTADRPGCWATTYLKMSPDNERDLKGEACSAESGSLDLELAPA